MAEQGSGADGLSGVAELDLDRVRRRGIGEAVLCSGKTVDQVVAIARVVRDRSAPSSLLRRRSRGTV